jgi:N-acetylneuraminic acid mutarotase
MSAGTWTLAGNLNTARYAHTATLLTNGQVLVAGGYDQNGQPLASAELFNPRTNMWSPTGSMNVPRIGHTATLLPNGEVLVAGGWDNG